MRSLLVTNDRVNRSMMIMNVKVPESSSAQHPWGDQVKFKSGYVGDFFSNEPGVHSVTVPMV